MVEIEGGKEFALSIKKQQARALFGRLWDKKGKAVCIRDLDFGPSLGVTPGVSRGLFPVGC